jgi:hypothetical protein
LNTSPAGACGNASMAGRSSSERGPLGLFLWFGPAVWIGSHVPLLTRGGADCWKAFGWTFVCGAPTALTAWLCGRGLEPARRAFDRRFGSR